MQSNYININKEWAKMLYDELKFNGYINLCEEDIWLVAQSASRAEIFCGVGSGKNALQDAYEDAVEKSNLKRRTPTQNGVLICLDCDESEKRMDEFADVIENLRDLVSPTANIFCGMNDTGIPGEMQFHIVLLY